jgi:hypothetical protein
VVATTQPTKGVIARTITRTMNEPGTQFIHTARGASKQGKKKKKKMTMKRKKEENQGGEEDQEDQEDQERRIRLRTIGRCGTSRTRGP